MNINSMTGFGRAETFLEDWSLIVEAKSLNHRFLEIVLRLPRRYQCLEDKIRKIIRDNFIRGRIEIYVQINGTPPFSRNLSVQKELITQYINNLKLLKVLFNLSGEIEVSNLLYMKEAFSFTEQRENIDQLWQELYPVLSKALEELSDMRKKEGKFLRSSLEKHISIFKDLISEIASLKEEIFLLAKQRLEKKLKKLTFPQEIDPIRLHQEIVILADKTDITEEIERLYSHIEQFNSILKKAGACGRKLDFLIQEMFREINTTSTKAGNVKISHLVVEAKTVLEKIREQVQNIE